MPNLFRHPIHRAACLVYVMYVADSSIAYLADGVPKQVRHDVGVYTPLHVADFSIAYLSDGVPKQVRHDGRVYTPLHVADYSIVYLSDGVPKQVRHDGFFCGDY